MSDNEGLGSGEELVQCAEQVGLVRNATDEIFEVLPSLVDEPFNPDVQARLSHWLKNVGPANQAARYLKEIARSSEEQA